MADDSDLRIRLSGVTKRFDGGDALDGIDLVVRDNESVVVIGPSASGKTVLLKTIIGLLRPEAGEVAVAGRDGPGPGGTGPARAAMLFQRAALFDSMPVWQNVTFGQARALPRREAMETAIAHLANVGLGAEVAPLYPAELSGGMQKRVGLARALATAPDILLLDDPTAGLDPVTARRITDLIRDNSRKLRASAVVVTSDMASARALADRMVMLHRGRLVWAGGPSELDSSPNPYIRQFVDQLAQGPIDVGVA